MSFKKVLHDQFTILNIGDDVLLTEVSEISNKFDAFLQLSKFIDVEFLKSKEFVVDEEFHF